MRQDLLALGAEDLASLSNLGNVKRATKELDRGRVKWTLTEQDGDVTFEWSDGPTTVIPADSTVSDARCSCPATSVCRHIVRAVIAYQRERREASDSELPPARPWDPGSVSDDQLAEIFHGSALSRWRTLFDEPPGLVVELVRSAKPTARFHRLGHTIRFLVPDDGRYTRCDCNEDPPCRHVALAVLAFRRLAPERESGTVETTGPEPPLEPARVSGVDRVLATMTRDGLAETPKARVDRWRAIEDQIRNDGLLWLAEVLNDIIRQWTHYHGHDARFSPARLADLTGELIIRRDALSAEDLPVPRLFVRGEHRDMATTLGQTRLVGLGTSAIVRHASVDLVALSQDTKSGKVMSFVDTFPDPGAGSPRHTATFSELARKPVLEKRDYATLGRSQIVIKSATLNPDHSLKLGRSGASAYGQDFRWDGLLAPVLCESVAELEARIASQPPASLQPRRIGEDLVVLPVAEQSDARFESRSNLLRATISDHDGAATELLHPYSTRGRTGLERTLEWLRSDARLVYLSARGRLTATGLKLSPVGLVFERGGRRVMVQPWVDDMDDHLESASVELDGEDREIDLVSSYRERLADELGRLLVRGEEGFDPVELGRLAAFAGELGLGSHVSALEKSVTGDRKALLELLVVSKLAQELA